MAVFRSAVLFVALTGGCSPKAGSGTSPTPRPKVSVATDDPHLAAVVSVVDPSVDPCTDFYAFACGGTDPEVSTEDGMYYRLDDALWAWMTEAAEGDGEAAAIRRFVAGCRDEAARDAAQTTALAEELAAIDAVTDAPTFMHAAGVLQRSGVETVLSLRSFPVGGGPFVPLLYGPRSAPPAEMLDELAKADGEVRAAYEGELRSTLERAGQGAEHAGAVVDLQLELRRAEPPDDAIIELSAWTAPEWTPFREGLGLELPASTRLYDGGYLAAVVGLARRTPPEVLGAYLRYELWSSLGLDLPPSQWVSGPYAHGTSAYCAIQAQTRMSLEMARAYGLEAFGAAERARAVALVEQIRAARLEHLDQPWVGPQLEPALRRVVEAIEARIAWVDEPWAPLPAIDPADHLANVMALRRRKIRGVVDPALDTTRGLDWDESQFLATAWNDGYQHTVSAGLGLLQPPLFDGGRPRWLDVASVGFVLGHELHHSLGPSHLEDHLGHVGADPALAAPVLEGEECLKKALSEAGLMPPYDSLEENLCDIGGLRLALPLVREALPDDEAAAGDLGAEQLTFVAATRLFCMPPNPDDPRTGLTHDRINATVAVMPEFAEAFSCGPGARLRVEHECATW